jgi:SAM-dependent methyltransferase
MSRVEGSIARVELLSGPKPNMQRPDRMERFKSGFKSALRRAGLLPAVFRIYEAGLAVAGRGRSGEAADGLPLPPALLRVRVVGSGDPAVFLRKGVNHANLIADVLARVGTPLEQADAVLDFGCGCGRILRYWRDLPSSVHGSDHDDAMIRWCAANLPFARFTVNELAPPLTYADDSFDVIYAFSVFTHIPERLQRPWLEELSRITRPGGHLLLTTHGDVCARTKLAGEEREAFRSGRIVTRNDHDAGCNLCSTFHPVSYVREQLSEGLLEVEFIAGRRGSLTQDVWLFRKSTPEETTGQG